MTDYKFLRSSFKLEHIVEGACERVDRFEKICRIGEGTYGIVYKAKERKSGQIVALKKVRMEQDLEGLPISSLREISLLKTCQHENVVQVFDVVVGSGLDNLYMVMEYCELDLAYLLDHVLLDESLRASEVKCLMLQLLKGVDYLHHNFIIHRDLKMSNLLLSSNGSLKIADFGLARSENRSQLTPKVVTLWYRSPELLYGVKDYGREIDMWAVGCIFAEFITSQPLLPGANELEQINLINNLLGDSVSKWPDFLKLPLSGIQPKHQLESTLRQRFRNSPENCITLIELLLEYDPKKRISARRSMQHEYFNSSPAACSPKQLTNRFPLNSLSSIHIK